MKSVSRNEIEQVLIIVVGLVMVIALARTIDSRSSDRRTQFAEEALYLDGATAKHLSLAFNGLAADWYWMRSLQYVGRKLVDYEDTHSRRLSLGDLSELDLRLLPSMLRISTTLDPQFLTPYEYGGVILPEVNLGEAIALLNQGIAANPSSWKLYQHLGYIYWQRQDYQKASEAYAAGARLRGAPAWMAAISARMKAEGGSHDAAREMYRHIYDSSNDETVKEMVMRQIERLDSLDERDVIRRVLNDYAAKTGRCVSSWREVSLDLQKAHLRIEMTTGAPIDPSATPYQLIKNGCDVDLDENTKVPKR